MDTAQISHTEIIAVSIAPASYPHPEGTFHSSTEMVSNQSLLKSAQAN